MIERLKRAVSFAISLGTLYVVTCTLGFGLLILAFKIGILRDVDILFYRGLVLVVLSFLATYGVLALVLSRLRLQNLGVRDSFSAAVLSLSLNLSFLVVVPVTVDRSISIFMLGEMATHSEEVFTAERMTALFTRVYVGDHRQIDRRLYEQSISGNVQKDGGGYKISPRGKMVVAMARIVAALFDSHAGLLAPASPSTASPR